MAEKPTSGRHTAWAIINPWGDLWTPTTFWTEAEARRHLEDFWRGNRNAPDLSTFTVEKVRVTISRIKPVASNQQVERG